MITYNGRPVIELVRRGHVNVDDVVLRFLAELFDHRSIARLCGERFRIPLHRLFKLPHHSGQSFGITRCCASDLLDEVFVRQIDTEHKGRSLAMLFGRWLGGSVTDVCDWWRRNDDENVDGCLDVRRIFASCGGFLFLLQRRGFIFTAIQFVHFLDLILNGSVTLLCHPLLPRSFLLTRCGLLRSLLS